MFVHCLNNETSINSYIPKDRALKIEPLIYSPLERALKIEP